MLLLVLTSYLFVQGPHLWALRDFFCPQRLFPVFDRLALLDRPRFSRFPKKVMKKVITSGIPISRTSRGNANWFEKSGLWHQITLNWPGIV